MLLKKLFTRQRVSDKLSEEITYADLGVLGLIILIGVFIGFRKGGKPAPTANTPVIKFSSQTVDQLPEAKPSEVVELKNGDTYNLAAEIIKKKIGSTEIKMLGYNGSIPGPLIKVAKGAEVTINFTNNTEVENTIHSHGVRLDNEFDGLPGITQEAVQPGQTFSYKVKFPDEGIYWYHPHVREDYSQSLGLYGNYLVMPDDPNYWSPVNQEQALMLSDILMEGNGVASFDAKTANRTLMGRFGNTMLINGDTNYKLEVNKGDVVRFYFTNTANARPFNISIPGVKMKLVGADNGKYEKEQWVDSVLLGPSERAIVEAEFTGPGPYSIVHKTPDKTYVLGTVAVSDKAAQPSYDSQFQTLRTNQNTIASIDPFRADFDKQPDKTLTLTLDMKNMMSNGSGQHQMSNGMMMNNSDPSMGGMHMMGNNTAMENSGMTMDEPSPDGIEWEDTMGMMNANSTTQTLQWKMVDQTTGKANDAIDWKFKVGDKVKIKITNDKNSMHPMQHPIHFHGQKFLVLSTNGVKNTDLVWKDTVLIPTGDTVELLVDMENPGTWMAHCHIAEHLEAGMMLKYTVE